MHKCAKCSDSIEGVNMYVEGGNGYFFCKTCSTILDSNPKENVASFLGPRLETWVAKNIREARDRRARGEGFWK